MSSDQSDSPYTLFKSSDLLVLNKPPRKHFDEILPHSVNMEPVHRLDFETSGCLLYARGDNATRLRARFKNSDKIRKIYLAGASKALDARWLHADGIHGYIGGRYRSSKKVRFSQLRSDFAGYHSVQEVHHRVRALNTGDWEHLIPKECDPKTRETCLQLFAHAYEVELVTGARHQIRAFFMAAGAPLKGDPVYNLDDKGSARLALHSWKFQLQDAGTGQLLIDSEAPLVAL